MDPFSVSPKEAGIIKVAFEMIENVSKATALVLIMENEHGVFLQFPNGSEARIVRRMRDTDWNPTLRLVEEHCEP